MPRLRRKSLLVKFQRSVFWLAQQQYRERAAEACAHEEREAACSGTGRGKSGKKSAQSEPGGSVPRGGSVYSEGPRAQCTRTAVRSNKLCGVESLFENRPRGQRLSLDVRAQCILETGVSQPGLKSSQVDW
jgi:hypothetical protein